MKRVTYIVVDNDHILLKVSNTCPPFSAGRRYLEKIDNMGLHRIVNHFKTVIRGDLW